MYADHFLVSSSIMDLTSYLVDLAEKLVGVAISCGAITPAAAIPSKAAKKILLSMSLLFMEWKIGD